MRALLGVALVAIAPAVPHAEAAVRCSVAGSWAGVGDDAAGNHWTFTLDLVDNDGAVSGTFHRKNPTLSAKRR